MGHRNVVVLGCGPSGLMAARAAWDAKCNVRIYSKRKKSPLGGAQYLHRPLPGMSEDPDGILQVMKSGTAEEYAQKVYGNPGHATSWGRYTEGMVPIWNLQKIYNKLWEQFKGRIYNADLNWQSCRSIAAFPEVMLVVSTIPLPVWVPSPQRGTAQFTSQDVWIHYGPDVLKPPEDSPDPCFMIYNGRKEGPYRISRIFGFGSEEFPEPVEGAVKVTKPISTSYDIFDGHEKIMMAGRYGAWEKNWLTHHVYERVRERLDAMH